MNFYLFGICKRACSSRTKPDGRQSCARIDSQLFHCCSDYLTEKRRQGSEKKRKQSKRRARVGAEIGGELGNVVVTTVEGNGNQ